MAVDVKVPSVGESITQGSIARWLKKDGDQVRTDDHQPIDQRQRPPQEPATPARPTAPPTGRETRQPMSALRQRIAERLLISQKQTASLTTFNEADMSAVTQLRTRYKDKFNDK